MVAKQAIREQRIPFEISRDNFTSEILEALKEVEEMKKNPSRVKSYASFKESEGCADMHCRSDAYLVEELILEYNAKDE